MEVIGSTGWAIAISCLRRTQIYGIAATKRNLAHIFFKFFKLFHFLRDTIDMYRAQWLTCSVSNPSTLISMETPMSSTTSFLRTGN